MIVSLELYVESEVGLQASETGRFEMGAVPVTEEDCIPECLGLISREQ